MAELGFYPAECDGRTGRIEDFWKRIKSEIRLGESLKMESNYHDKIPNNVDLGSNRTLQRALEHWQPEFLNWWHGLGLSDFNAVEVYLCMGITVDLNGGMRLR